MKRDEIVAKLKAAGGGGMLIVSALNLIARAGLTIIPKIADEQEIERVREALTDPMTFGSGDQARAAAAAVRG